MKIDSLLRQIGFKTKIGVKSRHSLADLFSKGNRCGIYVLQFSDTTFYVGQSIDVVKRFSQHKRNYDDILFIFFKPVPRNYLNNVELQVIGIVESAFETRNIHLASSPECESDLDSIISVKDQNDWLHNNDYVVDTSTRFSDKTLRNKFSQKFSKITQDDIFHDLFAPVLKKYILKCIIEPCKTEVSFWGCSCLPGPYAKDVTVYSRINLFWQEVFTAAYFITEDYPHYSFHVSKHSIKETNDNDHRYNSFKTLSMNDHFYQTGGHDQFCITVYDKNEALNLLDDELFVYSAKLFNLRSMRKGAHAYARYHCLSLADILLPK